MLNSHPMHRMRFGQYQGPWPAVRWPGERQPMQWYQWPQAEHRKHFEQLQSHNSLTSGNPTTAGRARNYKTTTATYGVCSCNIETTKKESEFSKLATSPTTCGQLNSVCVHLAGHNEGHLTELCWPLHALHRLTVITTLLWRRVFRTVWDEVTQSSFSFEGNSFKNSDVC